MKKSNWGLHTGLERTTQNLIFSVILNKYLCLHREYANMRKNIIHVILHIVDNRKASEKL